MYAPYLNRLEILKHQYLEFMRLICDLSMCFNVLKGFVDCNFKGCPILNRVS